MVNMSPATSALKNSKSFILYRFPFKLEPIKRRTNSKVEELVAWRNLKCKSG